jgi:hypothetical protein
MIFGLLLTMTGCSGLSKTEITPHPDAPILITDTFGGFVKGAVYDKEQNAMIPVGWFPISRYNGWTLHKFDWNTRIEMEKDKEK